MSFNRSIYDNCSYQKNLENNVSTLSYILSPMRYENSNKCRHQLGFLNGTNVSHIQGNLVDLESDLRGQTRLLSKCDNNKYIPTEDNIVKNDKTPPIDVTLKHLPSCQSITYRSVNLPPPMKISNC